jgi:hypothetical protein
MLREELVAEGDVGTEGGGEVTRVQRPGLTEDERTELERLRAEVAALRSGNDRGSPADPWPAWAGRRGNGGARSWPRC